MSRSIFLPLMLLFGVFACAPAHAGQTTPADGDADRLAWWREARFGMFIHWGPVSLKGTEIGWSRAGERRGHRSKRGTQIPVEVYDNLYKQFNPTGFDAEEWVQIAKDAGMRYLVFTTKHHDGFVNFDSRLTDYKITSPQSPFGRDIVAQLARACHASGLRLGFYYSQPDWHHPHYRELCTNYGKVDIIWFDGLGGGAADWNAPKLIQMIRELQPGALVNNRCGLPADFDTPEQRIGSFNRERPWETCMTIGRQWAWKPNDQIKSLEECIQTLVQVVGGDGNLLFNVGPMPDGRIEPRQVERLRDMGRWLKHYGESIYGTRGGPLKPGPAGVSTCRGNNVYLHILNWPEDGVPLPTIPREVVKHAVLTGGHATLEQTHQGARLWVRPEDRDEIDTIVLLELDGSAETMTPINWRIRSGSLAFGKPATASNTFRNMAEYQPDKAIDDDEQTRWATDSGTEAAWIQVDLGQPTTFNRVRIREAVRYGERIRRFQLEYKLGDEWKVALSGRTVGRDYKSGFPAVTARHVRLNILEATEGPTIWELQLFGDTDSP
jgi:alpha-L-fucosidase